MLARESLSPMIRVNDGCASQYKSINGFSAVARRKIKMTRIYFESSHGKSKSDGLGGVVKAFVSRAVSAESGNMVCKRIV